MGIWVGFMEVKKNKLNIRKWENFCNSLEYKMGKKIVCKFFCYRG